MSPNEIMDLKREIKEIQISIEYLKQQITEYQAQISDYEDEIELLDRNQVKDETKLEGKKERLEELQDILNQHELKVPDNQLQLI